VFDGKKEDACKPEKKKKEKKKQAVKRKKTNTANYIWCCVVGLEKIETDDYLILFVGVFYVNVMTLWFFIMMRLVDTVVKVYSLCCCLDI